MILGIYTVNCYLYYFLSYMHLCLYNLSFTVQSLQINYSHQQSYHFWNYATEELKEYLQLITQLPPENLAMQPSWKVIFEKHGELIDHVEILKW